MPSTLTAAFALVLGMTVPQAADYRALFDGTLRGWTIEHAEPGTFTTDAGVLRVSGSAGWLRADEEFVPAAAEAAASDRRATSEGGASAPHARRG